ncbi:MAG: nucleotidyltransferase domain-containing protein [Bdellovibrionaceae bacterium]|nr:nucleotidyltransferase domain-containing protein [Pseudobdellovibrionaceae bacterium]
MSDQFGLSQEKIQKINSVFQSHPLIEKVVLYGSRAKGNYKPGSDIDLTISAPEMTLSELLKIENEIDDLLLPNKVDLSLIHKIDNQNLIDHIQRVGVVFYSK